MLRCKLGLPTQGNQDREDLLNKTANLKIQESSLSDQDLAEPRTYPVDAFISRRPSNPISRRRGCTAKANHTTVLQALQGALLTKTQPVPG